MDGSFFSKMAGKESSVTREPLRKISFFFVISISNTLILSIAAPALDSGSSMSIRREKSMNAVETMKKIRRRKTTSMSDVSWRE